MTTKETTKPLALVFYESLLPGTQLVNRLQDLGYRVAAITQPTKLLSEAKQGRPLVVVMDLASQNPKLCDIIRELKQTPETGHIPVLAFTRDGDEKWRAKAQSAGAALVAGDVAILAHLPQLLDQVLEMGP
jgi:CheY-like chemotaxis protein